MVKNIGTPSLVERYGGRVDSPPMSHGVSVFSLGDSRGSKTKLSFGRRTQVRRATHAAVLCGMYYVRKLTLMEFELDRCWFSSAVVV